MLNKDQITQQVYTLKYETIYIQLYYKSINVPT